MKTSKIVAVSFDREWSGPNGVVYFHSLKLANDDYGSIGSQEKMPEFLQEGKDLDYTIEQKGEYRGVPQFTIRRVQSQPGNFAGRTASGPRQVVSTKSPEDRVGITRSVALNNAVQLYGQIYQGRQQYSEAEIVKIALYFQHYLETGENLQEADLDTNLPF
jgi:hypothetical protein